MANVKNAARYNAKMNRIFEESIQAKKEAANKEVMSAIQGVLDTVCYGDHGNIKDQPYICLAMSSPEIKRLECALKRL